MSILIEPCLKTNKAIQIVIEQLRKKGLPPLPVAPAQDPRKFHKVEKGQGIKGDCCPLDKDFNPIPLYTGKNPSYLDKNGKPHLISHSNYQEKLPTNEEIEQWFTNPQNGIGTLGGWDNVYWIDIDAKHFDNQEACNLAFQKLLENSPKLRAAWLERTQSGGYRIGIRITNPPNFTNFQLEPDSGHVGEILGKGRFTVLAPTIGPSGNSYETFNLPQTLPVIDTIDFLYPTKQNDSNESDTVRTPRIRQFKPYLEGAINLRDCLSSNSQNILAGDDIKGDRSDSLATLANDAFGWGNWFQEKVIPYNETPEDLIHESGAKLGIDEDRIKRIITSINFNECRPSAEYQGGDDSCWKIIYKLDRALIPANIEQSICNDCKNDEISDQSVDKVTTLIDSIKNKENSREQLSQLLNSQEEEIVILKAAIRLSHSFNSPIDLLSHWIEKEFEAIPKNKIWRAIKIVAAIATEYGDEAVNVLLVQSIKDHTKLPRVDIIRSAFKSVKNEFKPHKKDKQVKFEFIQNRIKNLQFNELTQKVERDGAEYKNIELAYISEELIDCDLEISKEFAVDSILSIALQDSYHPVKNYLESLKDCPQLSDDEWDNLASILLGANDKLSQIILKKALIAAVARIYQPGCYVRMLLVVQGGQNLGKSTFFRILASDEFFCDSLGKLDNPKDDYQLLHSYWIHEWGEIDKLTKKSSGDVKAFITKTKDDFRAPYARKNESHPRQSIIWGTCNRTDFLQDATGNTRYSVIAIGDIDLEKTKQWRDRIWATAKARFEAGETWELTKAEQALSEKNNENFTDTDPWLEPIGDFIDHRIEVSIKEIFNYLELDTAKQDRASAKRVRDCLMILGWTQDKNATLRNGVRVRRYRPPLTQYSDTVNQSSVSECVKSVSAENLTHQDFTHLDTVDTVKLNKKKLSKSFSMSHSANSNGGGERNWADQFIENQCVECVRDTQTIAQQALQPDTEIDTISVSGKND